MVKKGVLVFLAMVFFAPAFADSEEDEMAAMQRQLNAGVMAQSFDPGDQVKLDAFMKEAIKNKLKPKGSRPSYWKPGYTCNNIYSHGYRAWRNCHHYHRYYGRYW